MSFQFNYDEAFSRNIGWVTEAEQHVLRSKRVAIAGMGGVGGVHLLTLARLGISAFNIADLDIFELANFNRQVGATLSTLKQSKVDVLSRQARDINPELDIKGFPEGVSEANISEFLSGVDLYVDGLDFFALPVRRMVFARCVELGIPAITAAPLGMGVAYLIFMPDGMSFEEYFCLEGLSLDRQYINFLMGLSPRGLHRSYLVDPSRVNLAGHRGPSTAMACQLCAGVTGIEALKILLGRGEVRAAPYHQQFDGYQGTWVSGRLPGGNRHPLQRLKCYFGYRMYTKLSQQALPTEQQTYSSEVEKILDLARWAPSGDNAQPWRFEIIADDKFMVHVPPRSQANVYEYNNGQPSFISLGCLLENIRIAASQFGRACKWSYRLDGQHEHLIEVEIPQQQDIIKDALLPFLATRSVDRRPYKTTSLSALQKQALTASLGSYLEIRWFETLGDRWRMTRLNTAATDIRLSIREAFDVHQRILDWKHKYSVEGVPVTAVGLDALTLKTMQWVMQDWKRMHFMNRFLGGTITPRVELDILPGLFSAAHFVMVRTAIPSMGDEIPTLIRAGESIQRFWLTATRLGLVMQPSLAPLCFAHYGKHQIAFTSSVTMRNQAENLAVKLGHTAGVRNTDNVLFMGRLGVPKSIPQGGRSVRRSLASLWNTSSPSS